LAIQPDGGFFVAGVATAADNKDSLALARYNGDGSLDTGFGAGGKITSEFAGKVTLIRFQADGKIMVAGSTTDSDFTLARYHPDASLDTTFGVDGKITTAFSASAAVINDLAFTPQGQIIAVGTTGSDSLFLGSADIAVVRYNDDGSLDERFGNQGIVNRDFFGLYELGNAVVVQPDGNFILVGFISKESVFFSLQIGDYLLLRFSPEGSLDPSFGDAGAIKTDFGLEDQAFVAGLQKDGRLVVGGFTRRSMTDIRPADFTLARYFAFTPPPTPDFSLGVEQTTINVTRGQTLDLEILIQRVGGFAKPLTLTAPDVSTLKIKLSPQTVTVDGSTARFTLKIKKAPIGSHPLTFTARADSGLERQVTLNLSIRKN
jgi:uncharacterized delta-60 repeat protein